LASGTAVGRVWATHGNAATNRTSGNNFTAAPSLHPIFPQDGTAILSSISVEGSRKREAGLPTGSPLVSPSVQAESATLHE
jgi:hypothetical protein